MADESEATSTALVAPGLPTDAFPCVRFGRAQYTIPKDDMLVKVKKPLSITLEEFVSMFGTKSSPSRSPHKWGKFVSVLNYGIVKVNEGRYPIVVFDVEGHPEMKNFAHFVPLDPARELFPKLYATVSEDPAAAGVKLDHGSEERRVKEQARIDGLQWKPDDCTSSNNKSGTTKPVQPSPTANGWRVVPDAQTASWCTPKEAPTTVAKPTKVAGGKRKAEEALPEGFAVRVGDSIEEVAWTARLPVGGEYSTKKVGDVLIVTSYAPAVKVDEDEGSLEAPETTAGEE
jgi:hypothetical protein